MTSVNKCESICVNGAQCTRNITDNSKHCWQHADKSKDDVKSKDDLRFVYSIDIIKEKKDPSHIRIFSKAYLWYLDTPIEAASVTLNINYNDGISYFPFLPVCRIYMQGFYNYFKSRNYSYNSSKEKSVQLINIYNTFTAAQKSQSNGLTCALLKVTFDHLLTKKIISKKDYMYFEAFGNLNTGKNDLIGLSNYYSKLGFTADPSYLARFKEFYKTHSDMLDENGYFINEEYIENLLNINRDLLDDYKIAYTKKSKDLNEIKEKVLNEYLDPFAIVMYGKIENILNTLGDKKGVCPRKIAEDQILINEGFINKI
jgi:hypothetical protein